MSVEMGRTERDDEEHDLPRYFDQQIVIVLETNALLRIQSRVSISPKVVKRLMPQPAHG